jgi:hypothetical protein
MSSDLDYRQPLFDRRLLEAAAYAYEDWLAECTRVRNAYTRWSRGRAADHEKFFAAYLSALEGEQLAADRFQEASARLRRVASPAV